ncbi:Putative glucose-6-phosphate 1-epimerase [Durusdinium trenchii]|uniref:Glucose-6-phosphate 1-epimerase n=1 Tax=Durusdinium trenchii TaxID=1381693 RepID=A0ABP0IWW2_9DINO
MSIQQRQGIAPTWMLHQLEALESDCDGLERRWRQVQGQRKGEEHRLIQRLRSEHESQLQELGRLRETIKESKEEKPSPPSLEPLEQEAAELRREIEELQRRKHAEEAHAEEQRLALKVEIGSLQEQLQQTLSQKSVMEDVVEGLKSSHSATADSSREVRELQQHQEFLEKECVRSERRIIILDEKIDSLSKEAEDLRQRATVVLSALPDAQDSEACGLQHKQRQVQELRREQAQLQKEQEAADQEFEAAKVEASVLERKIRSLGALPSDR